MTTIEGTRVIYVDEYKENMFEASINIGYQIFYGYGYSRLSAVCNLADTLNVKVSELLAEYKVI